MKITGLTKGGVTSAIAERVNGMAGYPDHTYTLIIEPESRGTNWLLVSVEIEDEPPPD